MLSYSYSKACPPEKQKFYLLEAKESFETGLLSKKDDELVTSKQELHSFVKAAFCLTKVHQKLYGESMMLSQVSQLCQEALEKLYTYGYSPHPEEQDKEMFAKEIMCRIMSVKEQLQVPNFPNSDTKSYVPDSYKKEVEKQIVNGERSFETILQMYSQHHAAVCEVSETACKSHAMRKGEGKMGACITAMKTETRNVDTVCATEEKSRRRKDPVKIPVSQKPRKGHESLKGPMRKKLSRVPAVDLSLDEETESELSERAQSNVDDISSPSLSKSERSSSLQSWSKLSKSSSFTSWEELDNHESEMPQEKETKIKGFTGKSQHHSAVLSEGAQEGAEDCNLGLLSSKAHNLSLQGTQSNCTGSFKHPFTKNTALADKPTDLYPHFEEGHLEGTEHEENASKHSLSEARSPDDKDGCGSSSDFINPSSNGLSSSKQDQFGMVVSSSVKDSNNGKRNTEDPDSSKQAIELGSRNQWPLVDPEGETVDTTQDTPVRPLQPGDSMTSASIYSAIRAERDNFVQNWINKSVASAAAGASLETPEVDPKADTVDDWEFVSGSGRQLVGNHTDMNIIRDQPSHGPETPSGKNEDTPTGRNKPLVNQFSDCTTTEEDEGEKRRPILSSRLSSSCSLKSWYQSSQFSSSFSELENSLFLDSSGSSFSFIGKTKEQVLRARDLSNDDYERLLSGAEHTWLVERLKNTGLFKPKILHKAYCKYNVISKVYLYIITS